MFSTITTEPSTSIPIATAMPPNDIKLADSPNQAIILSAKPIEIGMDSKTKNVALKSNKNSANTMIINTNASNNASITVCTAWLISAAWL